MSDRISKFKMQSFQVPFTKASAGQAGFITIPLSLPNGSTPIACFGHSSHFANNILIGGYGFNSNYSEAYVAYYATKNVDDSENYIRVTITYI